MYELHGLVFVQAAMVLHPNGKLYYSHPDEHVLRNVMNIKVGS